MRWPLDKFIANQGYTIHPPALDMAAPYGTTVKSPVTGTVIGNAIIPDGGLYVVIREDHPQKLEYYMGHMQLEYVSVGQRVREGQAIGEVGSTGQASGPHVHFQIRRYGGGALVPVYDVYEARNKELPKEGGDLILKELHIKNRFKTYLGREAKTSDVKNYIGKPESVLLHNIIRTLLKRLEN